MMATPTAIIATGLRALHVLVGETSDSTPTNNNPMPMYNTIISIFVCPPDPILGNRLNQAIQNVKP